MGSPILQSKFSGSKSGRGYDVRVNIPDMLAFAETAGLGGVKRDIDLLGHTSNRFLPILSRDSGLGGAEKGHGFPRMYVLFQKLQAQ